MEKDMESKKQSKLVGYGLDFFGLVLLIFGGGGTVLGAWLAARLRHRLRHSAIWVTAVGMALAGVLLALAGLAEDPWLALTWYAFGLLFMTLPGGTAIQVVQEAVPNALRGQASAIETVRPPEVEW